MESRWKHRKGQSGFLFRSWKGWLFLMPGLLGLFCFYILPYGRIIRYSVQNNPVEGRFVGIENYKELLNNAAFKIAAENTVWITVVGILILVPFSLLLACILEKNTAGNNVLRICILSPMVVPAACVVMVWRVMFGTQGVLNQILMTFGAYGLSWFGSVWSRLMVIIMFVWKYAGYNMVVFWGALINVPQEYIEVAELEGAGSGKIFWKIKLRCISPTVFFVVLISIMNSLKLFREIYLLTGSYPSESLYLLSHFLNNTLGRLDYQKMSAAAILFSMAMIVVIGILFLLEKQAGKDMEK